MDNDPYYRAISSKVLVGIAKGLEPHSGLAKIELLRRHRHLIRSAVNRARLSNQQSIIEPDDLRQSAVCAFLEALETFDPELGTDLGAHAYRRMVGAVLRLYPRTQSVASITRQHVGDESKGRDLVAQDDGYAAIELCDQRIQLRQSLERLPLPDRALLVRTVLLGVRQATIARERGVSRTAVSKARDRIMSRVRASLAAWEVA